LHEPWLVDDEPLLVPVDDSVPLELLAWLDSVVWSVDDVSDVELAGPDVLDAGPPVVESEEVDVTSRVVPWLRRLDAIEWKLWLVFADVAPDVVSPLVPPSLVMDGTSSRPSMALHASTATPAPKPTAIKSPTCVRFIRTSHGPPWRHLVDRRAGRARRDRS
jgi:hypothetical protein